MKETFKAGDEVYCPRLGHDIYTLTENKDQVIYVFHFGGANGSSVTENGFYNASDKSPSIFHATPEKQKQLEAVYGYEFESPKLKGSDLTRKLLSDGAEAVLCYVSDISDGVAADKKGIRVISDYTSGTDSFKTSLPNGSFQYWRYAVPCNDYANLVDGVLTLKSEQ